jgi:hypothetical protein
MNVPSVALQVRSDSQLGRPHSRGVLFVKKDKSFGSPWNRRPDTSTCSPVTIQTFFLYLHQHFNVIYTFCYKCRIYWKIFFFDPFENFRTSKRTVLVRDFRLRLLPNHQSAHLWSRKTDGQARAYAAYQNDYMFRHSAGNQFWWQLSPAPSFYEQGLMESVIWLTHDTCCQRMFYQQTQTLHNIKFKVVQPILFV